MLCKAKLGAKAFGFVTIDVKMFTLLFVFFATDTKSSRRASLETADLDVFAASFAITEGALLDASESLIEFFDEESFAAAKS